MKPFFRLDIFAQHPRPLAGSRVHAPAHRRKCIEIPRPGWGVDETLEEELARAPPHATLMARESLTTERHCTCEMHATSAALQPELFFPLAGRTTAGRAAAAKLLHMPFEAETHGENPTDAPCSMTPQPSHRRAGGKMFGGD